jgi:hypothetical protein
MRTTLIIFTALFMTGYVFTSANAKQSPTIDELDVLLDKVSKHIESSAEVTKMAHTMNDKMVELKVEEKAQLKEAIAIAEIKVDVMTKKVEVYAVKMIGAGLDTSEVPLQLSGKAYDAWLNYVEEGGKEDFEYFRLYIFN